MSIIPRSVVTRTFRKILHPIPVVLEASGPNGLAIIRGLGAKGIQSVALSSHRAAFGFKSRHSVAALCPDPQQEPQRLVEFLCDLGACLSQRGVLFLTDDTYLSVVSKNQPLLEKHFDFPFSPWSTLHLLMDKKRQIETAMSLGIAVPRTIFVSELQSGELEAALDEMEYPAILKGQFGKAFSTSVGRQVLVVQSAREAIEKLEKTIECDSILQEIIPGRDDCLYTVGSYLASDGTPVGVFTGRKLRQRPRDFGTSRAAEALFLPELAQCAIRLLRSFGYHGVSQVEFKKDPRNGQYKLIEINARYWMWHSLATACGVNLAYLQYSEAVLGARRVARHQCRCAKKWYMSFVDVPMSLSEILTGRLSVRSWASTLSLNAVDAVVSWRDPLPSIMVLAKVLRAIARNIRRRLA